MASAPAFSSFSSTAPFSAAKSTSTRRPDTACFRPDTACFRPSRISAAYASVERPRTSASTSATTLYDVLGLQTSATCQEIKQAYRRLARVSHPDVASSGAHDDFIRIHSAYATLSDPEKRADYDRAVFVRRRPASYSTAATPVYSNRRWETDQCW
uniref:J domain-containing protein n=1 Tax=Kalanchoe fedtschenkoi TaxID=63787 RepID=A0A7N0R814_KALFE